MALYHTVDLRVRSYEVDRFGCVHNHVIQHYLEEAATDASRAAGLGPQWYSERNSGWVIRHITLEYLHPARINDTLEIRTWVSDFRRVRSHREYIVCRQRDGRELVRASTDWVYIDRATLWPTRIPADAIAAFSVREGVCAVPPVRPPAPVGWAATWRARRRAQRHEIDSMGHVNNANYVTWFEQALVDSVAAHVPAAAAAWLCWRRHDIEYLSAILPGEEVEIITRLTGLGHARAAWHQEVRRLGSDDAAVVDDSIVLCMNSNLHLQPWPRDILCAPGDA